MANGNPTPGRREGDEGDVVPAAVRHSGRITLVTALIGIIPALLGGLGGVTFENWRTPDTIEAADSIIGSLKDQLSEMEEATEGKEGELAAARGSVQTLNRRVADLQTDLAATMRERDALRAVMGAAFPTWPARPEDGDVAVVAVSLDSIDVLEDGGSNARPWTFGIEVDHRVDIPVPRSFYDDDRGMHPVHRLAVFDREMEGQVSVTVVGQGDQQYRVQSTLTLPLPPRGDTIQRFQRVYVTPPDDRQEGDFVFYFTIERRH